MNVSSSEATAIAEYEALRAEIVLRLGFHQQLLNYSFIAAGLIVPIVGLLAVDPTKPTTVLALLLVGPVVAVALQLVYIKQYVYIQTLATYICSELGQEVLPIKSQAKTEHPTAFGGWERYLNDKLVRPRLADLLLTLIDTAEGLFPILIGALFLLPFYIIMTASTVHLAPSEVLYLKSWAAFDSFLILAALFTSGYVRRWGRRLRLGSEGLPKVTSA